MQTDNTASDEPTFTPEEEAELVERINSSYYLQPNPPADLNEALVAQADRDAAADLISRIGLLSELTVEHIRRGLYDGDMGILARHRIAVEKLARAEGMEQAAVIASLYSVNASTAIRQAIGADNA